MEYPSCACSYEISIHKALASLDRMRQLLGQQRKEISIHKALASLDKLSISDMAEEIKFQSTRLSRASTYCGHKL